MSDSETFIQQIVDNKIQSGQSFTAYDVTLDVQEKLKTANLFDSDLHRHRHLKDKIHDYLRQFIMGGFYHRNLQDVGADVPAFVYHKDGVDPSNYVPQNRGSAPAKSHAPVSLANYSIPIPASIAMPISLGIPGSLVTPPIPVPALVPTIGVMNVAQAPQVLKIDADDEVSRPGDGRGTLAIPVKMLKDIGLDIGDKASVYVTESVLGTKILKITKELPPNNEELTTYTVDPSGNVRITKAVLKILADNASEYKIQRDENAVIVKV